MNKTIDLKNRIVEMFDVDTGIYEQEIISYLDRKMLVCFHSATFNNKHVIFTGNPKHKINNAITVSGYKIKLPNETISIDIGPNY